MDKVALDNPLFDCKTEKFWLHLFPKPFRMVFLVDHPEEANEAIPLLTQYGYIMTDKQTYRIESGVISYYIVMGVVRPESGPLDTTTEKI